MLPGLQPDPDLILTNIEILNLTTVPKSLAIIGAGAVGVEFASIFYPLRHGCLGLRNAAARSAGGGRGDFQGTGPVVPQGRHPRGDRRQGGERTQGRQGRADDRHAGGRQDGRSRSREVAGGRGPQAEHRKHRPGKHARGTGSRLHQSESVPADRRARRLRDRRRSGGHAATGARGHHGRHDRGGACRGQTGHAASIAIASRAAPTPSRASAAWG